MHCNWISIFHFIAGFLKLVNKERIEGNEQIQAELKKDLVF
jgi:hypothetical protein